MPAVLDQNQQDYASQLAKALGLQARIPGHLDPRIQVGLTLDDFTRPEFWNIRRGKMWQGHVALGAGVGFKAFAQLQGSAGTLCVVQRITISNLSAAVQTYQWGLSRWNATVTTTPGANSRDDRAGLSINNPACILTGGNTTAAPFQPKGQVQVGIGASEVIDCDMILTGKIAVVDALAFSVACVTANVPLDVSFEWRERAILPSELVA